MRLSSNDGTENRGTDQESSEKNQDKKCRYVSGKQEKTLKRMLFIDDFKAHLFYIMKIH